jgi:sugar lactone lactonase YvrE
MRLAAAAALIFSLAQAGTPSRPVIGDGGPATSAWLRWPTGIAMDASGNLFIAADFSNRIRKVAPNGIISTIAGTGGAGFMGDGGPATAALLNGPKGVAVDKTGNIFIADSNNNRIRKITPNGVISTFAGNGIGGLSGDGGPATAAQILMPFCVAFDPSGNLLIGTMGSIRRVTPNGLISTVAGGVEKGFNGDGGPAAAAQLGEVLGIAVDKTGTIYAAGDWRVRKITAGGIISIVFGNGSPAPPISSVAVDDAGNVYIGTDGMIRRISLTGTNTVFAGNGTNGFGGDGGLATGAQLGLPEALVFDGAGSLLVADHFNHRIRKITPDGVIRTIAGNGDEGPSPSPALRNPIGIAVDASGNLFVSDEIGNRIQKISPNGTISTFTTQVEHPTSLAVDSSGNIFAVSGARIQKISGAGVSSTIDVKAASADPSGRPFQPGGIAVDSAGSLFVADSSGSILKVTPDGATSTVAGSPAKPLFNLSYGIAVGAAQDLFVIDSGSNRVVKISRDGTPSTVAGNGSSGFSGDGGPAIAAQLRRPVSVALDKSGSLFISDSGNNRIRKVTPDGIIHTVAGNGVNDLGGDGGNATAAELNVPFGITVDAAGNLFIADTNNSRIRKVTPAGIISTVAGN